MLTVLANLLITLCILMILRLIDKKIKGPKSIICKIFSVIIVSTLLVGFIYLNGYAILSTFSVNLKSFTNTKGFFVKQLIVIFMLMILLLVVIFKITHIVLIDKKEGVKNTRQDEKCSDNVVFDINVIPNISVVFSHTNFKESIDYIDGFSFSKFKMEGNK